MADEPSAGDQEPQVPVARPLVTLADFESVPFENPIREMNISDAHDFLMAFENAAKTAQEVKDEAAQRVFVLLSGICSMTFNSVSRENVWIPLFTLTNGTRTPIAEDFRGEQTNILSKVVGRISNLALRARIADIAWCNNRKNGAAAALAVETYCDIVGGLLSGKIKTSYERSPQHEGLTALTRAARIATDTTKRTKRPEKISQMFEILHASMREKNDVGNFVDAMKLALSFGLKQRADAAPELEAIAAASPEDAFPLVVKSAWDMAAELYHILQNKEARQRCLKAAVNLTLKMQSQVSSDGAKAGWVSSALLELRHVEGMEAEERDLEIELKRLQKSSLKEMKSFEFDLKIGDRPEKLAEHFSALSLSEALKQFGLLTHSRDPDQLRNSALEMAKNSPLTSMVQHVQIDSEGRPEAKSAGAPHEGQPDETWFNRSVGQLESIHRARTVAGSIEPARVTIQARFGIAERHFNALVGLSPIIPEEIKFTLALGFTRMFQGDLVSAAYLLIPQLEPFFRHLLRINDHDPSKRRDDGTEEDLSLSGMYTNMRPELEEVLTKRIAYEVDLLFNAKPGPELRHELAHGKMSAAACYQPDIYYACWLIYHLVSISALGAWDAVIAPQLAAEE